MMPPTWTRLDNASLIYPACRTKRYATTFRMSVALNEDISKDILGQALEKTATRFPSFCYGLDKGFFWWILRRLENKPVLSSAGGMELFDFRKNGGFLFLCHINCYSIALFYSSFILASDCRITRNVG